MNIKYNLEEHLELLNYQNLLKREKKLLRKADKEKYLKLLKYSGCVEDSIHWKNRNEYLDLVENFINFNKINSIEFRNQFCDIYEKTQQICRNLLSNFKELENIKCCI